MVENFFATIAGRWPVGREDCHWHVLPGSELVRDRISRPYSEITRQAGLVPVRPTYLHITIQHVAPACDVTSRELDQVVGLVRDRCTCPVMNSLQDDAGRGDFWLGRLDYGVSLAPGEDIPSRADIYGLGVVSEGRHAGQGVDLQLSLPGALNYPRYLFCHVGALSAAARSGRLTSAAFPATSCSGSGFEKVEVGTGEPTSMAGSARLRLTRIGTPG